MCMAKKKRQGHYCRICGEYKANEKFSGKGHAQHICKTCMSHKKKGNEFPAEEEASELVEYDVDDMGYDMFNPNIDIMPSFLEPIPYKKLDKDTKFAVKQMWEEYVESYWYEEHLIPLNNDFNNMKDEMIGIFEEAENTTLKDDKDLKRVLHDQMLIVINKLLKAEKPK